MLLIYEKQCADEMFWAARNPTWDLLWPVWRCFGSFFHPQAPFRARDETPGFSHVLGHVAQITIPKGLFNHWCSPPVLVIPITQNGPKAHLNPGA